MEERRNKQQDAIRDMIRRSKDRLSALKNEMYDLLHMDSQEIEETFGDMESWSYALNMLGSRIDILTGKIEGYEDAYSVMILI